MIFCIWLFNHFYKRTCLVKEEGHAMNTIVFATHEFFRPPYTKLLNNGFFWVRYERKIELVFVDKFSVGGHAVGTNSDYLNLR